MTVEPGWLPPEIDTGKANIARVYDYWLGGTSNFLADQDAARALLALEPNARAVARAKSSIPAWSTYPCGDPIRSLIFLRTRANSAAWPASAAAPPT